MVAFGENLQEINRVRDPRGAYKDNVHQGDLHHLMSRPSQFCLLSTEASSFHYGVLICAYLHLTRDFLFLTILPPDIWHVAGLTVSRRACWDLKGVSDQIYALA